jgi:hypothetical protein
MEDAIAAQKWVKAITYERNNPTPDPMTMGGGDPMAMLDKLSAGTNNPSIAGTKALAAQFAQPQSMSMSRYPQGYDPYGNGGWAEGGPNFTTTTTSGPVIGPQGAVYPSSQTVTTPLQNTSGIASGKNVAMPYNWN